MERRRYCDPVLIGPDQAVLPLERVPFDQRLIDEGWLQELLRAQPALLPLAEIEPVFAPAVCIGQEVSTKKVGSIDLLYISPTGYLTVVETKLWRNPEARREVIGQILDYARDLTTWTYDDLDKVTRAYARHYLGKDLSPFQLAQSVADESIDEAAFVDTVSLNLRQARFLLIIAGDGIRESVEDLVAFLQQTPPLPFTLALVELLLYNAPAPPGALLVVPQVVARTREITRAVVRVEGTHIVWAPMRMETPPVTLTEEDFFRLLEQNAGPEEVAFGRELLEDGRRLGLVIDWGQSSFVLKLRDPGGSGQLLTLLVVDKGGTSYVGFLPTQLESVGLPAQLGWDYFAATASLFQNVQVNPRGGWTRTVRLSELQARYDAFRQILLETQGKIEQAAHSRPGNPAGT